MNKDLKQALIIGGVVIVLLILSSALNSAFSAGRSSFGMMGGYGGWWMPIIGIIVLALVISGIILLVRGISASGGDGSAGQPESALEILKRRYARGKINKQEFDEKKKDLS